MAEYKDGYLGAQQKVFAEAAANAPEKGKALFVDLSEMFAIANQKAEQTHSFGTFVSTLRSSFKMASVGRKIVRAAEKDPEIKKAYDGLIKNLEATQNQYRI